MRGKLISITSHLKRTKGQKLADLQSRLKLKQQEDINNPNPTVKQEIKKLQGEINDIYTLEAQKNLTFLRQKYYEIGGKSAKYLAYKLRKQQEESSIYKRTLKLINWKPNWKGSRSVLRPFIGTFTLNLMPLGKIVLMPFSAI